MTNYRVIFEDPDFPEEPVRVLTPTQDWLDEAMAGNLPPVWVYWQLQEDEAQAVAEGRHLTFRHDPDKLALQYTTPRIGPLTEEEAMEYLIMKDVPRRVWGVKHNRRMFAIVKADQVPSDIQFRDAWRIAA